MKRPAPKSFRTAKNRARNGRTKQRVRARRRQARTSLPVAAYRRRSGEKRFQVFDAPDEWYEPLGRTETEIIVQRPGSGYIHAVSEDEIRERLQQLPRKFADAVEVIQLSRMTKKRALFPRYGMQWGLNVYLYPVDSSLSEIYVRTPNPQQLIEARMYGGKWTQEGKLWRLTWTEKTIKDFFLNNVLIHEIGHVVDDRNTNCDARERYANWFAIEYGYRRSR